MTASANALDRRGGALDPTEAWTRARRRLTPSASPRATTIKLRVFGAGGGMRASPLAVRAPWRPAIGAGLLPPAIEAALRIGAAASRPTSALPVERGRPWTQRECGCGAGRRLAACPDRGRRRSSRGFFKVGRRARQPRPAHHADQAGCARGLAPRDDPGVGQG